MSALVYESLHRNGRIRFGLLEIVPLERYLCSEQSELNIRGVPGCQSGTPTFFSSGFL